MSTVTVFVDIDLKELIPLFLNGRREDIAALRKALSEENYEELKNLGHSLKGVGGGYGFHFISDIGDKIEKSAKNTDAAHIQSLIDEIETSLDNLEIIYED